MSVIDWTEEKKNKAITLRLQRKPLEEVAAAVGVSVGGLKGLFDKMNSPELKAVTKETSSRNRYFREWTEEMTAQMDALLSVRASVADIAYVLKVSRQMVLTRLEVLGLPAEKFWPERKAVDAGDPITWARISKVPFNAAASTIAGV